MGNVAKVVRRGWSGFIVAVWTVALACGGNAARAQARFIPLGYLPDGNYMSSANAVSDTAPYTVVGFANTMVQSRVPFVWTEAGGMKAIGTAYGAALNISADGSTVVGLNYGSSGNNGAWRWTQAGGISGLGTGEAQAASADGSVIVGSDNEHAWRWVAGGGRTNLPPLPGGGTQTADGVSADGRYVVGQGYSVGGYRAYRYDASTNQLITLGAGRAGNTTDAGSSITPDGRFVTGSAAGAMARWVDGALVERVNGTQAGNAITPDGTMIVGYTFLTGGGTRAVIWDANHGMRNLKQALTDDYGLGAALAGWSLDNAMDISADGVAITGTATAPDGFQQAFVVLVPEPGTAGLAIGFAGMVLGGRRRRR